MKQFLVVSIFNNFSIIQDLSDDQVYVATTLKTIYKDKKIIVGDYVEATISNNNAVITKILHRENSFLRPRVANISNAIIISSSIHPKFDHLFVNKLILFLEMNKIKPILVFSKIDLKNDFDDWDIIYENLGYKVFKVNQLANNEFECTNICKNLKGINLVLGKSGVGKSTFINQAIIDKTQLQKIDSISTKLKQGKNTTTNSKIIKLANNKYLLDTPGFNQFIFNNALEIKAFYQGYDVFKKLANKCEFKNCSHTHEANCAIKNAVASKIIPQKFYNDYAIIILELKNLKGKIYG